MPFALSLCVLVLFDTGKFYGKISNDLNFCFVVQFHDLCTRIQHSFLRVWSHSISTYINIFHTSASLTTFFWMAVAMIRGKFNFSVSPALQKDKSIVRVTCTHFLIFQLHGYVLKVPSLPFQVIVIFQCTKLWIRKEVEESNCGLF